MTDTSNMPAYECHKKVHALEIASVGHYKKNPEQGALVRTVTFVDGTSRDLKDDVFRRCLPEKGWFYVVYEDGYESFSPPGAFRGGYKPLDDRTFADIKRGLKIGNTAAGTNEGDGVATTTGEPK